MESGTDLEAVKTSGAYIGTSEEEESIENSLVTVTLVNPGPTQTECSTLKRQTAASPRVDLSRADLIRLLSYLEGELQARDVVIATLKADKAKQMLYQAKYGRLGLNDPFSALQRDSGSCGANDDFDEASVGRLYESQLAHLERLIAVQRRAHHRAKQVLATAERRHARSVRELEQEKKRRAHDAAQGDDVCMMLEKERERLKQELENQKCEQAKMEKDFEKARQLLGDEKERHKQMVMYLLQERRQLLVRLMEERQKATKAHEQAVKKTPAAEDSASTSRIADEDASEQDLLRELDTLKQQLDEEKKETAGLRAVVRAQEEDLNLIRQMILAKSRQSASQQPSPSGGSPRTSIQSTSAVQSSPSPRSAIVAPSQPSPQRHKQPHQQPDSGPNASGSSQPQQQPIRLLTNPAYQQQPPAYHTGSVAHRAATPTRAGRPVPPPAPHQPLSPVTRPNQSTTDRADSSRSTPSSTHSTPRVIPIQYIGPSPANNQQHQTGGFRRLGGVATPPPVGAQGGVVSAARNYVSNVVAAVTSAATNSPLLSGASGAPRRGQTVATSGTSGGSQLREQWSYAAQATAAPPNDAQNYKSSSRGGEGPPPAYCVAHQQPTGSVARKSTGSSRGSSQQQVSEGAQSDRRAAAETSGVNQGQSGQARRTGDDAHGVKAVGSRRPPQHGQVGLVSPVTTVLRSRPSSPATGVSIAAPIGTKRTPTPAPSNRIPLPPTANGAPAPATLKTSALNVSPSSSVTDCVTPTADAQQQAVAQSTLGRKMKAVGGLANKLQKRVVAGVSGQMGLRQQRTNGDNSGKDQQNVRSTQV